MKKRSIAQVLVFVLLVAFSSFSIGQMAGRPWEKTVTVANGEVILDMSGEWGTQMELYGSLSYKTWNPIPDILTIMQFGTEFSSIDETGDWSPKATEMIKGKLDKDGFKEVYIFPLESHVEPDAEYVECRWEIRENGNKVLLDCGERVKLTLSRR